MKHSLSRLLTLRERLKVAAEAELNLTVAAMRDTAAHLETHGVGEGAQVYRAQDLQDGAYKRELAVGHLRGLTQQAEEQRMEVARTKREERQVELLVQKRVAQAAQLLVRREAATLDDWYRATTWEEK